MAKREGRKKGIVETKPRKRTQPAPTKGIKNGNVERGAKQDFMVQRVTAGRDKYFASPELLHKAFQDYKAWCIANPWMKHDLVRGGDLVGQDLYIALGRPWTIKGFCVFMNTSHNYLRNFKLNIAHKGEKATEQDKDFLAIIDDIEDEIYSQKFEGAALGSFNANIISRDLGLRDNVDYTTGGEKLNTQPPVVNVFSSAPPLAGDEKEVDVKQNKK